MTSGQRRDRAAVRGARLSRALAFAPLLVGTLACSHAAATASRAPSSTSSRQPEPANEAAPEGDPRAVAASLSDETRALLRAEGELLWKRWTSGNGAAPSSALAGHERLLAKSSLDALLAAKGREDSSHAEQARADSLLFASLAPQAVASGAGAAESALEQGRALLAFATPGETKAEHAERDLDRLLTDEPSASKRAAIAAAEATQAAPLADLALARDRAEEDSRARLGLPAWPELIALLHGSSPQDLAALAEATLQATQDVATRAVTATAERNLGETLDRLVRADLPRLVRASELDAELSAGRGWENVRATFAALGIDPAALGAAGSALRIDSEPLPAKAARPLALLVDPPSDVRLSIKNAGGFEEQRALLHETARALGGALAQSAHWELAQLGDGSAAEGLAWLAESLSGDPAWLRERTALRGEPLDDLVHTEATRRLLAVRRSAALVLFEVQRRTGPQSAESTNALYRGLLSRATLAQHAHAEGARWALETDSWLKAAVSLRAALLGAQLALSFESSMVATPIIGTPSISAAAQSTPQTWWHAAPPADSLRKLAAQGRALPAEEAARQIGGALGPDAFVKLMDQRLAYRAPEKPPAAPRPDYKFMQGDRGGRRKKHKKKSSGTR